MLKNLRSIPTKKTMLKRIYNNQRSNATKRDRAYPSYNFDTFFKFSNDNGFKKLYKRWKKTGLHNDLPSCDRVDSMQGYHIENLEWVTWGENKRRQAADRVNGVGSSGGQCKGVHCTGSESLRFHSIAKACRETGENIHYRLKSGTTDPKGRRWLYV